MAQKKNYRSDNTYMISSESTDNPKLGAKVLSDGRESLFLDFYFGFQLAMSSKTGREYKRAITRREYLKLYLWQAPRSPLERQQNRDTLELAKKIRYERSQELLEQGEGYRLKKDTRNLDLLQWMWGYYERYTKGDKRHIKRSHDVFVDFLIDPEGELIPQADWSKEQKAEAEAAKEQRKRLLRLKPEQLTRQIVLEFVEYLQGRFRGLGPHTLYARFKKVINAAIDADVIRKNPCKGIIIKTDNGALLKDILSLEEMQQLISTHYPGENPNIRRAFIFSCYCGLRWCDVKDLTFANVDYSNRLLNFEQNKTRGHSSASAVVIPLNDGLLKLIGKPSARDKRDELIFPLPSHTMCLKALRHWTAKAGIDKHITWHCARHSFAVNILNNGANIKTVASLLGHSGLQHTNKYLRAVDSLKEAAINSLPELKI